jgi:hypothetical protein
MRPLITIEEALLDPHLLRPALGDPATWTLWIALLKAAFAGELMRQEQELLAHVIGTRKLPRSRVRELWCVVGRRGGKSRIAAALAVYLALLAPHPPLAKGEVGMILVMAKSVDQAASVFRYAMAFLKESPALQDEIDSATRHEIRLRNGIVIAIHASSFRSVRGRTLIAAIFDEVAYWPCEDSAEPDREVYRAVLPSLATTRGMLVCISSGYRRVGLLYEKHRDFHNVDSDDVLVAQGATCIFNPTLEAAEIARQQAADPGGAEAEWEGGFRSDMSNLFADGVIERVVDFGRPLELAPIDGLFYRAFCDSAGGVGGGDAYTLAIGHRESNGINVVDVVRSARGQFDPYAITEEFAKLCRQYRCTGVTGDFYGAGWTSNAWEKTGVTYTRSDLNKSQIYLECLPLFARGEVNLPNHAVLLRELQLLQQYRHKSGRDTVDHPRNGHDDHANVVCGVIRELSNHLGYDLSGFADPPEPDPYREQCERRHKELMERYGQPPKYSPWYPREVIELHAKEAAAHAGDAPRVPMTNKEIRQAFAAIEAEKETSDVKEKV